MAAAEVIAKASRPYHVIIASRNAQNGDKALAEVKAKEGVKGSLSTIQLDVTNSESIRKAAKEVEKQFGRLDVLVNNAGIDDTGSDLAKSLEANFRVNVIGAALMSEAFQPLLLTSKAPYSIYVTSGLGSLGLAEDKNHMYYPVDHITYRVSKAALNMWAVEEHRILGAKGVKVFVMCPGLVESNLRGKSEEARSAGGYATSPLVSGETMLSIMEGKRDADVGKFVHKDGVYPW